MRAAFYETNGAAADVLHVDEVATPSPGPGEVRVRMKTSGINPSDVKSRSGLTRKIAFPRVIPHSDGAGEIDAVGDGVLPTRVGERVWTWNGQWKRAFGTAAEYVVLPARQAVTLPANVGFDVGAGIGIPAMTAWYAIDLAHLGAGQTVFIPGGAGAVGFYAIQFAKLRGARVITSVSSPAKADLARRAGADHVIDYKREDVAAKIAEATAKQGVDAIIEIDISAGAPLWPQILRAHGDIIVYGAGPQANVPAAFCLTNNINVRFILVYEMAAPEIDRALADISRLLTDGRLIHNIAQTFPLSDIVRAHQAVEAGPIGKVVVTI
ncbi:MAG: NADPH:quinone reductase [Xanthobacteraceae bacterium]